MARLSNNVLTKDLYAMLGVGSNATGNEIKTAYRKLAHTYHPDKNQGDITSAEKFLEIRNAWDILGNLERKEKYDSLSNSEYWKKFKDLSAEKYLDYAGFLTKFDYVLYNDKFISSQSQYYNAIVKISILIMQKHEKFRERAFVKYILSDGSDKLDMNKFVQRMIKIIDGRIKDYFKKSKQKHSLKSLLILCQSPGFYKVINGPIVGDFVHRDDELSQMITNVVKQEIGDNFFSKLFKNKGKES
jgi:curved DNA-binding protein CbpA